MRSDEPTIDNLPEPLAGLVRDHGRALDIVAEARGSVEHAAMHPDNPDDFAEMVAALEELRAFLERELPVHIAKEEQALFPALQNMAQLVEDMLGQHDEIRRRQALIEQMLVVIGAHRDDILPERAVFIGALQRTIDGQGGDAFGVLRERVMRLDWILQGHFDDEEENLLLPAATLLTAADLERLVQEMAVMAVG